MTNQSNQPADKSTENQEPKLPQKVELDFSQNKTKPLDKPAPEEILPPTDDNISLLERINQVGVLVKQIEQEIKRGYRELDTETYGKVRIYIPTPEIEDKITDIRSELLSNLLRNENIMTRGEIIENLKKRKLWSDEKEAQEEKLIQDIAEITRDILYAEHSETINADELKKLYERKMDLEKNLKKLSAMKDYFTNMSLENILEVELFKHQIVLCVKKVKIEKDKDGNKKEVEEPLWENIEQFNKEQNKVEIIEITRQAAYYWNGWHEDLLGPAPGLSF